MKTLATVLSLTVLTLAACDKPADSTKIYDPKHDGVTPSALDKAVDKSILDPQNRGVSVATVSETPAPTTAASAPADTAPAATAPAEGPAETAPAAN